MKNSVWMSVLVVVAVASVSFGDEFTIKDGVTSWNSVESYTDGTKVPGKGDIVKVPAKYKVYVNDAATAAFVSKLARISPAGGLGSEGQVIFDVPQGETFDIECAISLGYGQPGGAIVKRGPGRLNLNSFAHYLKTDASKTYFYDYYTWQLKVEAGTLYLPQGMNPGATPASAADPTHNIFFGRTTIAEGATLYLPAKLYSGNDRHVELLALYGEGALLATAATELRIEGDRSVGSVFAGYVGPNITYFSSGWNAFTGTTNSFAATKVWHAYSRWNTDGKAVMGVKTFGMAGQPSSLGSSAYFQVNVRGGTYLYLGDVDETTDKFMYMYADASTTSCGVNTLDAGAHGGLTFAGRNGGFRMCYGSNWQVLMGLTGSNEVPCAVRGQVNVMPKSGYSAAATVADIEYDTNTSVAVIKKGTGTWRFEDPRPFGNRLDRCRTFQGTISVDEGLFQFDTVAPVGEGCSIGTANLLKPPVYGKTAEIEGVDWQFRLGGTNAALTTLAEGALEYTGTNTPGMCHFRPFVLNADGRLLANVAQRASYRTLPPTSARAKKLTLDGVSEATNTVADVTDTAAAPVSVVKEGSGTWKLIGDQSFHGDLVVKGGKLIVHNPDTKYTWYRLTVKNMFDPVDSGRSKGDVCVNFFGLYDADGWMQNRNFTVPSSEMALDAEPGQMGFETLRELSVAPGEYEKRCLTNICVNSQGGYGFLCTPYRDDKVRGAHYPKADDPSSWLSIVFHLTNGAPAIASYDMAYYYSLQGTHQGLQWSPNRWSLEGSLNGVNWEDVNPDGGDWTITTDDVNTKDYYFVFSKGKRATSIPATASAASNVHHANGCPIVGHAAKGFDVLTNVNTVKVCGGTLEADGEIELSKLTVDAASAQGRISGFTFAESGEISLENVPTGVGETELPVAIDTVGADLSKWSVTVNGAAKPAWRVAVRNGKLHAIPPGLMLIVR